MTLGISRMARSQEDLKGQSVHSWGSPRDPRKMSVLIGDALRGLGFPIDVIVMTADRFEETKDLIGGIAYPANKLGRVIYEAA